MLNQELKRLKSYRGILPGVMILMLVLLVFLVGTFYSDENQSYITQRNQYLQGNLSTEALSSSYLKNQIETIQNFTQYNNEIIENNQKKIQSSLFNSKDNLVRFKKEIQYYQTLNTLELNVENTYVPSVVLRSPIFSILSFIFVIMCVQALFYQDVQIKILRLFESTHTSLKHLYISKILALLVSVVLFRVGMLLITVGTLKLMGLSLYVPIQFISGFNRFPYYLNCLSYLIMISSLGILSMLFIGSILIIFIHIFRNDALALFVFILMTLVQYLMHSFISITSGYSVLKYINVYAYLIGSMPSFNISIVLGLGFQLATLQIVALCVLTVCVSILSWGMYRNINRIGFKQFDLKLSFRFKSLALQEFFQMGILYKAFLICVILIGYNGYRYMSYTILEDAEQANVDAMRAEYLGIVDADVLEALNVRILDAQEARDKLNACIDNTMDCDETNNSELIEKANNLSTLVMIRDEIEQVLINGEAYYSNIQGYEQLFGRESLFSMQIHFITLSLALMSLVFMFVNPTKTSKIDALFDSTLLGRKQKKKIDLQLLLGIGGVLCIGVYGIYIAKILKYYNLFTVNYPMSLILDTDLSLDVSLAVYMVCTLLIRALVYGLIVLSSYRLARQTSGLKALFGMIFVVIVVMGLFTLFPEYSPLMVLTTAILEHPVVAVGYMSLVIGGIGMNVKRGLIS
ncbi:hypothetical protein AOC36_09295 [Erysipelothrix larvae]|uniref:Uncharacterized protein n=2 Tax=Erysipelothrix larvae TaxID=1514105 RepID=A0A0X8H177_9FIRM|nr:hypothetical protein [Erysipelothrix larvae]AMC94177.1 hypothetical protein AOC36_09295 [Erysipelothrix larvae]